MTDLKIAAAYIRVSTDDQVELSPASQLVEIRKWGTANGYLVPDEFVFVDEAKSGRKVTGRDEFRRLIATAKTKPKPFDAILLWKFSRFARNRDDAVYYKSILRKQLKIEVISIKEPIEDGKMGVIMESMIEAMDEYYSINLAEDVKRGMEEKHRRGELQATPSFGYTVLDNVLVPVPEEAVYVQEIFSRFVSGEGFYSIARWLNSMGVKTHRGSTFANRTVEYILRNPVYIGKLRWNPAGRSRRDYADPNIIVTDGKHEPLVSEETFQQAQTRIAQLHAQIEQLGYAEHARHACNQHVEVAGEGIRERREPVKLLHELVGVSSPFKVYRYFKTASVRLVADIAYLFYRARLDPVNNLFDYRLARCG